MDAKPAARTGATSINDFWDPLTPLLISSRQDCRSSEFIREGKFTASVSYPTGIPTVATCRWNPGAKRFRDHRSLLPMVAEHHAEHGERMSRTPSRPSLSPPSLLELSGRGASTTYTVSGSSAISMNNVTCMGRHLTNNRYMVVTAGGEGTVGRGWGPVRPKWSSASMSTCSKLWRQLRDVSQQCVDKSVSGRLHQLHEPLRLPDGRLAELRRHVKRRL